jgi:hypothetical protein
VSDGWYVYGVVDGDRALDDSDDDIGVVREGSVAAIVGPVDLGEFDRLDERLNDLAWLEQKARAHEAVLDRLVGEGAVVPLRFGAIYRRLDEVEAMLHERGDEFAADLDRVRGRVELGVKGFVERSALEATLASERVAASVGGGSSGRAYLERRRMQREIAEEASAILAEAARSTHERLLEHTVAGALSRPHSRELSGRPEEMFLNAAYLVSADDESLRGEVAALGRAYAPLALTFEVTGPWPPYSFVGSEHREHATR